MSKSGKKSASLEGAPLGDLLALAGRLQTSNVGTRVALIGCSTFTPMADLFRLWCDHIDEPVNVYSGEFDRYQWELMADESPLSSFKPQICFLFPNHKFFHCEEGENVSLEVARKSAKDCAASLGKLVERWGNRGCQFFIANDLQDVAGYPGSARQKLFGGGAVFQRLVFQELAAMAPGWLHILDLEQVARQAPIKPFNRRHWLSSRQRFAPEFQPMVAREMAACVRLCLQAPKKVLVLDLDQTLWGGVIGDDGMDGITLGDTCPLGEGYKELQRFIKSLADRGVLLAVCSKNEEATAREVFSKHPEMVLQLQDILAFYANWQPKADNINTVARQLNVGLDSIVFLDDNPAEIEMVRQNLPGVVTVQADPDPTVTLERLATCRYFDFLNLTEEDRTRVQSYRASKGRAALQESCVDMEAFLNSLQMQGRIETFSAGNIPRVAQLINKSNQFNLTTRRRSEADVQEVAADSQTEGFCIRLQDRFGDYGIVGVAIVTIEKKVLTVDTFLLSCRVLKRQVEEELVNQIFLYGAARGCKKVSARYVASGRNSMVEGFWDQFCFRCTASSKGEKKYELAVTDFASRSTFIDMEEGDRVTKLAG